MSDAALPFEPPAPPGSADPRRACRTTRGPVFPARAGAVLLAVLLLTGAGGRPGAADVASEDDDEAQLREVYVPDPEFQAYYDRDQLAVEQVTLVRVRRPDHSEALAAKEESGWEHVVIEGWRLAFYNQAKHALRRGPGRHVIVQEWSGGAHCCFDYHVLRVQGAQVQREGTIRGGDCSLRVADLDHDGALELIACDSRFAYAFDLPFAESPRARGLHVPRPGVCGGQPALPAGLPVPGHPGAAAARGSGAGG